MNLMGYVGAGVAFVQGCISARVALIQGGITAGVALVVVIGIGTERHEVRVKWKRPGPFA
jgi:hypothetical protein